MFKKKYSIASAPYRISLGGGGTDLPFYARKRKGALISASINEYITVMVAHRSLDSDIFLQYSKTERCHSVNEINHDIIREVLKYFKINKSFQIATFSSMPTFTGLGASSTLIVALLTAIYDLKGKKKSKKSIAEKAYYIERKILKLSGGFQDQYIASFGGIQLIKISKSLNVSIKQLHIGKSVMNKLNNSLFLIHSEVDRKSEKIILKQKKESEKDQIRVFDAYDEIKNIGKDSIDLISSGKISKLGKLMDKHWEIKKSISTSISSNHLNNMYEKLKSFGAIGGKIIGAGGGGFFLMVVDRKKNFFKRKLKMNSFKIVDFSIEEKGAHVIFDYKR